MPLEFHKMHGAGNDFVLIDARGSEFRLGSERATALADRHRGIGCDQILVLREPEDRRHAARYEIFNADGSPAGQCGNGARCIGLFLERAGETGGEPFSLESPAGGIAMRRCDDGEYEVEMGVPAFEAGDVPMRLEPTQVLYRIDSPWGELEFGAVSMGNPHAVVPVRDIDDPRIPEMGAFLGTHEAFPEGCNAGFALVAGPGKILLRVIERGAGETLACGSGACAAMAVLRQAGKVADAVDVFLPGGHLVIKWPRREETLTMKGPAEHVFRGTLDE